MVVMINNINSGAGPTGEFNRPGGARFEPGSGTHKLIPNRHAQVTVEVGCAMTPIEAVAHRRMADHLNGTNQVGGEIVLGTNIVAQPRTNDEWTRGAGVPSYDGPISIGNNPEFGRGTDDLFSGVPVPRWYPQFPGDMAVEDRTR